MRKKAPKSATKVRLKVQTHVWDHQAAGSNPVTRTKNPLKSMISADFFIQQKWLAERGLSFLRKAFANVKSCMNGGRSQMQPPVAQIPRRLGCKTYKSTIE